MMRRPPTSPSSIRFLQRGLIDENGGQWLPASLDTYFIEDLQVMREAMTRIKRVLVRQGYPAQAEELPVKGAEQRLLDAVPSARQLGGFGVRLYTMGGVEMIAVIEELHQSYC